MGIGVWKPFGLRLLSCDRCGNRDFYLKSSLELCRTCLKKRKARASWLVRLWWWVSEGVKRGRHQSE